LIGSRFQLRGDGLVGGRCVTLRSNPFRWNVIEFGSGVLRLTGAFAHRVDGADIIHYGGAR